MRIKKYQVRFRKKLNTFAEIAVQISELSVASTLKVGAISVKKDFSKIASFGYNGSYPKAPICLETGTEEESLDPGKSGFIHAEINMIAKFREHDPDNYFVLLTHSPCSMCSKVLVNAGFKHVYWIKEYRETSHLSNIFGLSKVSFGSISDVNNFEPTLFKSMDDSDEQPKNRI